MNFDFDTVIDRRGSSSTKWKKFGPGVLPFWVADMDFAAPDFILDALNQRLEHPILGYTDRPESLSEAFLAWLDHHFGWQIPMQWVVWIPGVVPGLNLAAQTLSAGEHILIPTPVYHPFLDLAQHANLQETRIDMQPGAHTPGWEIDPNQLQAAVRDNSRMLLFCNPQNPTGRCYSHTELAHLANFAADHNLTLVSDEIHANFVLDPQHRHIPLAQAFPDIAHQTISLFAATKIYNIPGVSCAAAVIPDPQLRQQFMQARRGLVPGIGPLGFVAAETALRDRSTWIEDLLAYLRGNLSRIEACVGDRLSPLQATYLAWIYVGDLGLENAEEYFAGHGLGISPGAQFGRGDYIRFNFGCPRATLDAGLERLAAAIDAAA